MGTFLPRLGTQISDIIVTKIAMNERVRVAQCEQKAPNAISKEPKKIIL